MSRLMLLVENAEQLDEVDFKKAAATAMAVGALAGAPQDTQASTDAAQGVDTNQPVATQQVQQPKVYNYKQNKVGKVFGFGYAGGAKFFGTGMLKDEFLGAVKMIHDKRPKEIGQKTSKMTFHSPDNMGNRNAHIQYTNGYLEIYVIKGGQLSSFGGFAKTPIGKEEKFIVGNVKFVVGNVKAPMQQSSEFDF
ncbi:hypothetical protein N9I83_01210 [bacterium]|nr:hypothetical protein [bacterium]